LSGHGEPISNVRERRLGGMLSDSFADSRLATTSTLPPGGNGYTRRIAFDG